ncbi:hypothetical protein JCM8547_007283 [Rhodosporidiobolus lusitaniae]
MARWSVKRNGSQRLSLAVFLVLSATGWYLFVTRAPSPSPTVVPYSYNPAGSTGGAQQEGGARRPTARLASTRADEGATEDVLDSLLRVPEHEQGRIAICASIHNEGRFLTEWLLYNRAVGVDRFYLYDTGSTDDTLEVLQPWLETGTVKLHRFNHDQVRHFQTNSLETCSRTYANETDWLLDCDVDEFYVVPYSLQSYSRIRPLTLSDMPDKPLWNLLEGNWLYRTADVIAAARITWKNGGIERLPRDASVLVNQNLRDIYHAVPYDKLEFTKSILHTNRKAGWIVPGAHYVKHLSLPPSKANIISVDGQEIEPDALGSGGTLYKGRFKRRAYEPLVMYHYVERDLENCFAKLRRAKEVRKGGWRDKAGEDGCKNYELYQPNVNWVPMHEKDSLYGGAMRDFTMSDSWYGQHLPSLIRAARKRSNALASSPATNDGLALPYQPVFVDPHPDLVEEWRVNGYNTVWGESPAEARAERQLERLAEEAEREEEGRKREKREIEERMLMVKRRRKGEEQAS